MIDEMFAELERRMNAKFDSLREETAAKFAWLARSVGQRLRVDR